MNEKQKYRRDGYNAASKFYIDAEYKFNDDLALLYGYQAFFNPLKTLNWQGHYQNGEQAFTREQSYLGLSSTTYGTVKYGQIQSLYYDLIGQRLDLYDYAVIGQPAAWSSFAHYDGSASTKNTLRYEKKFQSFDVYAAYLLNNHDTDTQQNFLYQKKQGLSLGLDLRLQPNLSLSSVWHHVDANLRDKNNHLEKKFNQEMFGSALFYNNDRWLIGVGGGWYKNIVPNYLLKESFPQKDIEAYGYQYYVGYKFNLEHPFLQSIRPYIMGYGATFKKAMHYDRNDYGFGFALKFKYKFGFDFEHFFTQDSQHTPDVSLFRLRYDW
ncbi:porin [Acinetobacter larvae]|nr:porin [Acinetobacter larvae]